MNSPARDDSGEAITTIATVGRMTSVPGRETAEKGTSRFLWVTAYVVLMGMVALRLPQTLNSISTQVPQRVRDDLGDDRLLNLSMTVGAVLFFIVYGVIMVAFFCLVAFLDKKLVPNKWKLTWNLTMGPFFVIAIISTIPVNIACVVFEILRPRDMPGFWLLFPTLALIILVSSYNLWQHVSPIRKITIVIFGIGVSLITVFG